MAVRSLFRRSFCQHPASYAPAGLLLLGLGAGCCACQSLTTTPRRGPVTPSRPAGPRPAAPVRYLPARRAWPATWLGFDTLTVPRPAGASVERLYCYAGQTVRRGQLLARVQMLHWVKGAATLTPRYLEAPAAGRVLSTCLGASTGCAGSAPLVCLLCPQRLRLRWRAAPGAGRPRPGDSVLVQLMSHAPVRAAVLTAPGPVPGGGLLLVMVHALPYQPRARAPATVRLLRPPLSVAHHPNRSTP